MNSVDVKDQPLKISLKRYLLILGTALFCLMMPLSGPLLGGQHEVQVDFSFDVDAVPGKVIAGYRLYIQGQELCNTGPVDPQNITCMVTAEDGTYDFTLAARYDDNSLSPQSAAVPFTITTEAPPPEPVVASITADPTTGEAPFSVNFNGSSSTGLIASYAWGFGDGNTANDMSTTHMYQTAGTYTAMLTVTAADGTTDNDTVVITVSEPPPPPVASISPQNAAGVAPFTVQFDGGNSTGTISSYAWSFGDGASGSGQSTSHTYLAPGTYTAMLTVAGAGSTSVDSVTIEVSAPPVPPVAAISSSSTVGEAPLTVNFDGSGSSTTQKPMASYYWDFGDGTTATGPVVNHNYTIPNNYNATLTVTDNVGLTDSASTPVMINPPAEENQPPVSSFTLSSSSGVAPLMVTFDGAASDDPDGSISTYHWTLGDGTPYTGVSGECEFTEAGEYLITLEVTDDNGESDVSSQTVIVDPEEEIDLFIEISEIQIDDNWTPVSFSKPFNDPVVIVGPPSFSDSDPATVRIRNVTANGFEIRIQKWDYLKNGHGYETVSLIAIEKGVYTLQSGAKIEAGIFEGTADYQTIALQQSYELTPVILSQVMTESEADAVTGRIRNVSQGSYEYKLQEQESTSKSHQAEMVGYIAWEPGIGDLGNFQYEVGLTGKKVTHKGYTFTFQTNLSDVPLFLADMQTQTGGDTAVLRELDISKRSARLKVEEEKSKDKEVRHSKENVGFLAIIGTAQPSQ